MNDARPKLKAVRLSGDYGVDLAELAEAAGTTNLDFVTQNGRVSIVVHDNQENVPYGKIRISVCSVEYMVLGRHRRDDTQMSAPVLVDRVQFEGNVILQEESLVGLEQIQSSPL